MKEESLTMDVLMLKVRKLTGRMDLEPFIVLLNTTFGPNEFEMVDYSINLVLNLFKLGD